MTKYARIPKPMPLILQGSILAFLTLQLLLKNELGGGTEGIIMLMQITVLLLLGRLLLYRQQYVHACALVVGISYRCIAVQLEIQHQ